MAYTLNLTAREGIPGVYDLPTRWIYERRGVADVSIDEGFQFGQIHFIHEGIMRGS